MSRSNFLGLSNQSSTSSPQTGKSAGKKGSLPVQETPVFIDKHLASHLTGLSQSTLKKYRLNGSLIENIHWIAFNKRAVLYNRLLLLDWVQNCNHPQAHQQAIEAYLGSLPANQPKKRGRKSQQGEVG